MPRRTGDELEQVGEPFGLAAQLDVRGRLRRSLGLGGGGVRPAMTGSNSRSLRTRTARLNQVHGCGSAR